MDDFFEMGQPKPRAICRTCGCDWSAFEHKKDCAECGDGALQIPCPVCSGTCGAMWDRAVLDSNDSGEAHWIGKCYHQHHRYAELGGPPRPKQRYLYRFGYHNLEQLRLNALFNDDAECSEWIFVEAPSKAEAVELGRLYADLFVMKLFKATLDELEEKAYQWSDEKFAEWLEEDLQEIAAAESAKVATISNPQEAFKLLLK